MLRDIGFKRYFLSWMVILSVIYLFFGLSSEKIFASIDGEANCHLWTVGEIDAEGNMELKDYKSDGSELTSIVVPNAADFKAYYSTRYANLKKVWISLEMLKKVVQYANQAHGEFKISKTKGQDAVEKKVFPGDSVNATDVSLANVFAGMSNIRKIDLENLDVSNVVNMSSMFYGCTRLVELNLDGWDTSNVTDMFMMFSQCINLEKLNMSNWNTARVNITGYMFEKCKNLVELNLNNWDTGNVTDMQAMFYSCTNLKKLEINRWDVSKVKKMESIFCECKNLVELDLNNWDTSNSVYMSTVFSGCTKLKKLKVSNWKLASTIKTDRTFQDTPNLCFLDLNGWNMDATKENVVYSPFCIINYEKAPLLIRTRDNVLKDYDYSEDNRKYFTTTLKVDGDYAKFRIDSDEENVSYSENKKEKYITLYPTFTTTDSEEEIWAKLRNRLVEEREKIEFKDERKIDWAPAENYKYVADALGGTYMIGAEKYTATLKVDGEIAKFKADNNSMETPRYNENRTEKYVDIYLMPDENDNKKIVWTRLKKILEDEEENLEIAENYAFVKWNPEINENQEPDQSLGTYSVKTKGYLLEDVNFSWPELKTDLNVDESITIKDLFCIKESPNIPTGCKLIYKIGDDDNSYWVEYLPNDKLIFDKAGDHRIYLKIDGGENYFDKEYDKYSRNYMTLHVNEKYIATLKVDGGTAKFKDESPGSYSPDRTEKYIEIYLTSTDGNDKKVVWRKLKEILEAEKENIEVDSSHGIVKWNPEINESQEPNKSLGTYFINTKGYLAEGVNFSWPNLKTDIKMGESITIKDLFCIESAPNIPQGCKLIYKIGDDSDWSEYSPTNTVIFDKATDYKIYLKIDGGENYFDKEYDKDGCNYVILRIDNPDDEQDKDKDKEQDKDKDKKQDQEQADDSDSGTGIFHWDTISDGKKTLKNIGLPSRLKTEKYLEGYSDGTIKPDNNVKRSEFASMIYKLMHDGKEKVNTDILKNLNDVKSSDWYGSSVAYLIDKKIFDTGKNFRPNENVTRGEVAEIIYNVIKFYDATDTKEYELGKYYYTFTDLSGPVSDIIKQLASHGIVNGYKDKTFKQNNNITRAEVAKIIFTAFERKNIPGQKKYSDLDKKHWAYKFLMDASA